jgi:YD repeat-containing protein
MRARPSNGVTAARDEANFAWHSHHNPDGSEWISTYEYDDAGKLLTVRSESAGALAGLTQYEDDAAGRLVRVLYRPQTGDERMTESYEHSASGCRKKTQYVDLAAHSPNTNHSRGIEGTHTA